MFLNKMIKVLLLLFRNDYVKNKISIKGLSQDCGLEASSIFQFLNILELKQPENGFQSGWL
jgi:hypothetical protein